MNDIELAYASDLALVLGANIRQARECQGLSQRAVAKRAQLSFVYWNCIEKGHAMPRIRTLVRMSRALDWSVGELVEGLDDV
jgi:transcriptional regulator with XRE-family HTH domain